MTVGFFESVDGFRVRGWANGTLDRPPSLVVCLDNDRRVPIPTTNFIPDADGIRLRFDLPLSLRPGTRVEIFDREGNSLPGGVRFAGCGSPEPRIGILATLKSEFPYLIEWVAYHRALGVVDFFLGDNGGDDGTSDLLRRLDAAGLISRLDWRQSTFFQYRFYHSVMSHLVGVVDIVAVIDGDEFLRPLDGRRSIPEAAAELFSSPDVSAVALNWAMYGSSGLSRNDGRLIIERFTCRAKQSFIPNQHVKTLIRPECYSGQPPNPHYFEPNCGRYLNSRGEPVAWSKDHAPGILEKVVWNALRVDHYHIKSREEFTAKLRRGRVDIANADYPDEEHFKGMDRNEISDPLDSEIVERTHSEIARIRNSIARRYAIRQVFDVRAALKRYRLRKAHESDAPRRTNILGEIDYETSILGDRELAALFLDKCTVSESNVLVPEGWAAASNGEYVKFVDLSVGRKTIARVKTIHRRPDVKSARPYVVGPNCGFIFSVPSFDQKRFESIVLVAKTELGDERFQANLTFSTRD